LVNSHPSSNKCCYCFDVVRYTLKRNVTQKKGSATGNYVTDSNPTRYKNGDVIGGLYYEYAGTT